MDNVLTLELGWSSERKFVVSMYSTLASNFDFSSKYHLSLQTWCLSGVGRYLSGWSACRKDTEFTAQSTHVKAGQPMLVTLVLGRIPGFPGKSPTLYPVSSISTPHLPALIFFMNYSYAQKIYWSLSSHMTSLFVDWHLPASAPWVPNMSGLHSLSTVVL